MLNFLNRIPCLNIFKKIDIFNSFNIIINCYLDSISILFYAYLINVIGIIPNYNSHYYVKKCNTNINFKKIIIKVLFYCGFIQLVFHYKIKDEIRFYKLIEKYN